VHDTLGDGKIFVLPVEESRRIRTGEQGLEAILLAEFGATQVFFFWRLPRIHHPSFRFFH
jgi:hypothetical protein